MSNLIYVQLNLRLFPDEENFLILILHRPESTSYSKPYSLVCPEEVGSQVFFRQDVIAVINQKVWLSFKGKISEIGVNSSFSIKQASSHLTKDTNLMKTT